jgi:hypothetical protein
VLLMLEGGTGLKHKCVVYREIQESTNEIGLHGLLAAVELQSNPGAVPQIAEGTLS